MKNLLQSFRCLSMDLIKGLSTGVILFMGLAMQSSFASDVASTTVVVSSAKHVTPVVELYTSEGCSSCPPADEFLTRLGDTIDDDFHAVPLAFHVDYWNWLGWRDPYSQAKFTERQRKIADVNKQRAIYTPELVVTGQEARGSNRVVDLISERNRELAQVQITMEVSTTAAGKILANLTIDNMSLSDKPALYLALYENDIEREIGGGENKGRTLLHNFVVRHLSDAVSLDKGGTSSLISIEIEDDWQLENIGVAALVVDVESGQTLQAVSTPLSS